MKFQKNKNWLLAVMLVLAFAVLMTGESYADCDMFGMLATEGHTIPDIGGTTGNYNDPEDFFDFLENHMHQNGYGIIYYKDWLHLIPDNQIFRNKWDDPLNLAIFEEAKTAIYNEDNYASLVLGHSRFATGGNSNISDPHPFVWDYDLENYPSVPFYTFEHNGTIYSPYVEELDSMITYLFPYWFTDMGYYYKTPLIPPEQGGNGQIVDTERYLHWIIANIKYYNGNVIEGIHHAVEAMRDWDTCQRNFVFSDGNVMYIFRARGNAGSGYYLSYYDGLAEVDPIPFRAVKTQYAGGLTHLDEDELVYIPRSGDILELKDFNKEGVSGIVGTDIDDIWTEEYSPYYIVGDVHVPENVELTIEENVEVYFLGPYEFGVEGNVTLCEGASFNLWQNSAVVIDGANALFFLDWGSTITGANPKLRCDCCPGDRIIAQNGGRITTGTIVDYENYPGTPPSIEIYSRSAVRWWGIVIENPDPNNPYWFVNCDISGICKIHMCNTERSKNGTGKLNLYYTDYTNCNPIYVNNIERLTIKGLDNDNRCNISNNQPQSVYATSSPVTIKYANIENNSCDGVYLAYASVEHSKIDSSYFTGNGRNGIYINDHHLEKFNQNHVENNACHGVYSWLGIFGDFDLNIITNNGGTEFIGHQMSYHMEYGDNGIKDEDGNSGGWDQYILAVLDWDGVNQIPVMGNTIPHGDETRFYPCFEAFDFGDDLSKVRQLLNSAFSDMNNQDYDNASITLNQIINEYPESDEAVISVKCLYYIENYTDKNFTEFRDFLDTIQAEYGTSMYKVKEDVKTKTYMDESDYIMAIERLEEVINNPPTPDDSIYAVIDEAYCYLKLSEDSTRAMPVNCSVRPSTFSEYQETVRELESKLSFFNDIDYDSQISAPKIAMLHNNYPNPFNPITTISFSLADNVENAKIEIFNIKGQKIKTLVNSYLEKGTHNVVWNGKDKNGKKVVSGLYFYKLTTGKETAVKKMLLLR